jgi:signal transduction histidine kinase
MTATRRHGRIFASGGGLRLTVLAFCAGLLALMWIGLAYQLSFERDYAIERRESENDNLARLFEEHVRRTLAAASVTLKQLETEYRQHGGRLNLARYFDDRRAELEPYSILSVIDEHGDLMLSTLPFARPQNLRNVENFQIHSRETSQDVFISKPRLGVVTGSPTIYLSRRMNKADGSFGGYTVVGMDAQYFSRFYDQIDLGPDSVVVLLGRDGVIRARRSDTSSSEKAVGRDMHGAALFGVHLPHAEHGKYRATSPIDGIKRLYSYLTIKGYPLVTLVGTSEAATLARFEERKKTYLWAAGVASVVIFAFAALVLLQTSRGARVTEELHTSEEKLLDYTARMRALSGRIVALQEEERLAVARELHDEIGQGLTAVKIYLQAAELTCEGCERTLSTESLHEALLTVAKILEQVRGLSLNLRPMQLDDLGLTVALSSLVARDAATAGWIAHFDEDLSAERLDSNIELACYRVAQEALTNVMRHAGASEVWITLRRSDQALLLTVRDNGRGFDLASARSVTGTPHLGLLGMEERVKNMAGQFEILTGSGEGTEVQASFPIATAVAGTAALA